jgi:hypothetical protein
LQFKAFAAVAAAHQRVAKIEFVPRPGDGHVEEPPFLLLGVGNVQRARRGKQPVAEHDDEHPVELQALRLMHT